MLLANLSLDRGFRELTGLGYGIFGLWRETGGGCGRCDDWVAGGECEKVEHKRIRGGGLGVIWRSVGALGRTRRRKRRERCTGTVVSKLCGDHLPFDAEDQKTPITPFPSSWVGRYFPPR